jgi:hypothetical protein
VVQTDLIVVVCCSCVVPYHHLQAAGRCVPFAFLEDAKTDNSHQQVTVLDCSSAALCCAVQAAGRRVPFAFLEDVKTSFLSSYADSYQQVSCTSLALFSSTHCQACIACIVQSLALFSSTHCLSAWIMLPAVVYEFNAPFSIVLAQRMTFLNS